MQERSGKQRWLKVMHSGVIAGCAGLALAIPQANASFGHDGRDDDRGLAGSWLVTLTPTACATGNEIPGAPTSEVLINFNEDGTLNGWFQNRSVTTTRSPSYGSWKRVRGPHGDGARNFVARFIHLRYDPASGAFLGRQYGESRITLNRRGDEFSTAGKAQGYSPDGVLQFEGCSTLVGSRIYAE
jgi:hypothetical protein